MLYEPDLSRPAHSNDFYRDYSLRLTLQATEKHKVVVGGSFQANCNCVYALFRPQGGPLVTPEAATEHAYEPAFNVTDDMDVPGHQPAALHGRGRRESHHADEPARRGRRRKQHPDHGTVAGPEVRRGVRRDGRRLVLFDACRAASTTSSSRSTYVTGSHSLKTGLNIRQVKTGNNDKYGADLFMANRAILYTFNNQRPVSLQLLATPHHFEESANDIAIYAQDQWTIRRLTLNLGLRYNDVDMSSPELVLAPGFFVGERLSRRRSTSRTGGISARVWARRTTCSATAGPRSRDRWAATRTSSACRRRIPANQFSLTTNRTWNDTCFGAGDPRSGNFRPDCELLNPVANGECGPWSDQNFGRPRRSTRNAPDSLEGSTSSSTTGRHR